MPSLQHRLNYGSLDWALKRSIWRFFAPKSPHKQVQFVTGTALLDDSRPRILYVTSRDSTPICRILACCRTSYEGNATLISHRIAFVLVPDRTRRGISVTRSDDRDNQRQHEAPWLRRLLGARVDFGR